MLWNQPILSSAIRVEINAGTVNPNWSLSLGHCRHIENDIELLFNRINNLISICISITQTIKFI